jgi:hypothetical protein
MLWQHSSFVNKTLVSMKYYSPLLSHHPSPPLLPSLLSSSIRPHHSHPLYNTLLSHHPSPPLYYSLTTLLLLLSPLPSLLPSSLRPHHSHPLYNILLSQNSHPPFSLPHLLPSPPSVEPRRRRVYEAEVVAEDSGDEFSHLLDSNEGEEQEETVDRRSRIIAGEVLHCTVLFCIVLYCIVLYCIVPNWTGLDWTMV